MKKEIDSIHNRIRLARVELDISQEELGLRVGVSGQSVQQWEAGKSAPRSARLRKLADVLNVTPDFLQFGIEAKAFIGANSADEFLKAHQFRENITTAYEKTIKTAAGLGWIAIKRADVSTNMLSELFYSRLLEAYGLEPDSSTPTDT